jgi:hypothetical protein
MMMMASHQHQLVMPHLPWLLLMTQLAQRHRCRCGAKSYEIKKKTRRVNVQGGK